MREKDNTFLIDGVPVLIPDEGVELSFSDLDSADSGRDEAGFMHRIVLRRGVRTWGLSYAQLTGAEYRYMQSLVTGKPEFQLTYEAEDGTQKVTTAYCSNHSVALCNRVTGVYKNLKFNIIEC